MIYPLKNISKLVIIIRGRLSALAGTASLGSSAETFVCYMTDSDWVENSVLLSRPPNSWKAIHFFKKQR